MFDRDFWKMTVGFIGIILLSLLGLFFLQRLEEKREEAGSVLPEAAVVDETAPGE